MEYNNRNELKFSKAAVKSVDQTNNEKQGAVIDTPQAAVSDKIKKADEKILDDYGKQKLMENIVLAMKSVYDPEIPVDIYELGLIYNVEIFDNRNVMILMTLTAPNCPVAGDLISWVHKAVSEVVGVNEVDIELTFDPPWDMSQMSDEARIELNLL